MRSFAVPAAAMRSSPRLKKHFSEALIVELTAAVALENFRSKFNRR